MPNNPLSTFRAVEPPFAGFQAAAGLASVPFVLNAVSGSAVTAAGTDSVAQTFPLESVVVDRYIPWTYRTRASCYPVSIPNAYDRVYIFPLYMFATTPGKTGATGATTDVPTVAWFNAASSSYTGPAVQPFGRFPQTYNVSSSGGNLNRRLPSDVIRAGGTTPYPDIDSLGLWTPLPVYATNALTANGKASAASAFATPNTISRNVGATVGVGNTYFLPNDLTISNAGTTAVTTAGGDYAAASSGIYLVGAGAEFSLQGCEELVVSITAPQTNPPQYVVKGQTTSGTGAAFGTVTAYTFLMGVFLG